MLQQSVIQLFVLSSPNSPFGQIRCPGNAAHQKAQTCYVNVFLLSPNLIQRISCIGQLPMPLKILQRETDLSCCSYVNIMLFQTSNVQKAEQFKADYCIF